MEDDPEKAETSFAICMIFNSRDTLLKRDDKENVELGMGSGSPEHCELIAACR
jgi:hypothetical protein